MGRSYERVHLLITSKIDESEGFVSVLVSAEEYRLSHEDPDSGLRPPTSEALKACPHFLFSQLDVLMYCCGLGHWRRVQSTYVSDRTVARAVRHCIFSAIATAV